MADVHSPEARSRNMAAIRSRNTKPEIAVRKIAHALGYRFRLSSRLPGRPDLVLPRYRKVIFVHGCFWHMHDCRHGRVKPATRPEFWLKKLQQNVERDNRVQKLLAAVGWRSLVIWECWLADPEKVRESIRSFISS